ncbi:MAG: hypothetical protein QW279_13435, partial [Candidatus Jordarchaeaceae archaeon]
KGWLLGRYYLRKEHSRGGRTDWIRIALKQESLPLRVKDWVMRKRKFIRNEEEEISGEMLLLDDSFFKIEEVVVEPFSKFTEAAVVQCEACGEWAVEDKTVKVKERTLCKSCASSSYCTPYNPRIV